MPALVPVPGTVRVVFKGTYDGAPTANVMHLHNGTGLPYTQPTVDAIATGMRAAYATAFLPLINSRFTLTEVNALDLSNNTGVVGVSTGSSIGSGGSQSQALPASISLCVSWKTTTHYRGGHGRTYFAGHLMTDQLNSTTWSAATITAWSAAAANFKTAVGTIAVTPSVQLVILSRYHDKVARVTPLVLPVVGATVDSRIDTQRRRLGRDR